jgi:hypothetical protein
LGAITPSIATLSIATLSIMTHSITTLSAKALVFDTEHKMTLSVSDPQHNNALSYAKCRYAECCVFFTIMLSAIMLSLVMLSVLTPFLDNIRMILKCVSFLLHGSENLLIQLKPIQCHLFGGLYSIQK